MKIIKSASATSRPSDIRPGCDFQDLGDGEWYTCESVSKGRDGQYVINTDRGQITLEYSDPVKIQKRILSSTEIDPSDARKIYEAAWGYDAVQIALNYLSDKLDGYDSYQDSFEVSYQGTKDELRDELLNVLKSAGLDAELYEDDEIVYENGGDDVWINIYELPEDYYTFTENSTGYGISIQDVM